MNTAKTLKNLWIAAVCLTPLVHGQATITPFDPVGSINTVPYAINADGDIAGFFENASHAGSAFLRSGKSPNAIVTFNVENSPLTVPASINASGVITGLYFDANHAQHGFVRDAAGAITTFDVPDSASTIPTSVNASGAITGYFFDNNGSVHGFVRAATSPFAVTVFDAPDSLPPGPFPSPMMERSPGTMTPIRGRTASSAAPESSPPSIRWAVSTQRPLA